MSGVVDSATNKKPPLPELRSGVSTAGFRRPATTATNKNVADAISASDNKLRRRCRVAFRRLNRSNASCPEPTIDAKRSPSNQAAKEHTAEVNVLMPTTKNSTVDQDSPEKAA